MNTEQIDAIANAVLYEGYILYPYRPCIKNARRLMFGSVAPRDGSENRGERCSMQTECLVEGNAETRIEVEIRFLQLVNRRVARRVPATDEFGCESDIFEFIESCELDGMRFHSWQEALERRVAIDPQSLTSLEQQEIRTQFDFPARRDTENLAENVGHEFVYVREQKNIAGTATLLARQVAKDVFCITTRIDNTSPVSIAAAGDDHELQNLVSIHTILSATSGRFLSVIDPPAKHRQITEGLKNEGTWPVLVGREGERDIILSSPIILYDYPQVAPESPGDWFDATEIDEMLDLRTRTLTDDEKRSMRSVDATARRLLERTELSDTDDLAKLHGTLRGMRRVDKAIS